jgi:hypothetical protein
VREQRVSNLLQSLLVAACLGLTPAIQQIPTGVLWGYFIFMAVKSLEGSQLWERLLLLVTDPKKRVAIMQQEHAAYMQVGRAARWCCCKRIAVFLASAVWLSSVPVWLLASPCSPPLQTAGCALQPG